MIYGDTPTFKEAASTFHGFSGNLMSMALNAQENALPNEAAKQVKQDRQEEVQTKSVGDFPGE